MHSGVMRQSLIDVTPFMPVSDFICEYCSCVIIPEEQCAASGEAAETKADEHKGVLKKEQQRKLQLDDETLMLARDVRSLRERRRALEDEVNQSWTVHGGSLDARQKNEALQARLQMSLKLEGMGKEDLDRLRGTIGQQLETAKKAREQARQQLATRQERIAAKGAAAAADANDDALVEVPQAPARTSLGRKLSFSRRKKEQPAGEGGAAGTAAGGGGEAAPKPVSGLTRVLSFGRSKKPARPEGEGGAPVPSGDQAAAPKRESVAGSLVRKLSFGKKKPS